MDIHSIGLNVDGRMVLLYKGGKREEFRKCPFPGCKFYHSEDLEFCPVTNGSIVEEEKRREEKTIRRIAADRVKARYEKEHLSGWKKRWREIVFFLGALGLTALTYTFSLASGLKVGYSMAFSVVVCFAWSYFWGNKLTKYVKQIRAQADEIYQRTLKGEEIEA